jgi:hypothetical protein
MKFVVFSVTACLCFSTLAQAQAPRAVMSTVAGHSTSAVPGFPANRFTAINRYFGSPSGNRFIVKAVSDLPTTDNDILLVGVDGPGGMTLSVVGREGQPATFAPNATETLGIFDAICRINDAGQYVFGTNTNNAPTASDEYIVKFDGTQWVTVSREDDPVPALPGFTYGCCARSCNITSDGRIAFMAQGLRLGDGTTPDILVQDGILLARTGVTVPQGQPGGGADPWFIFDIDRLFASGDGETYVQLGSLPGDVRVLVVGNTVAIQEGHPVPDTAFTSPVSNILQTWMEANGTWFCRGINADGQSWLVRNGQVIVKTGDPIFEGATENWIPVATFFWHFAIENAQGDRVIAGATNNPNSLFNTIAVWNNTSVILREGDPIDLNGNGQADDNAFVLGIENDSSFLTAAREAFISVTLKNGAGTNIGEALVRLPLPPLTPGCGSADFDCDGDTGTDADIEAFFGCLAGECPVAPCGATADFDADGDVGTDADIEAFFRVLGGGTC